MSAPSSALDSGLDWPPSAAIDSVATYERYAAVYDELFDDLDADAQFYLDTARAHAGTGDAILEIGVGTGRLTARLLDAGHRVVGLDASAGMLARAARRFGSHPKLELIEGDARTARIEHAAFPLAIAPYGMVAHLLTDDDRRAAFRSIYAHLAIGGVFVFDDCPSWLAPDDGTALHLVRSTPDGGGSLRLMTNTIAAADGQLGLRYDFIDRLNPAGLVTARTIVRIVFRNIPLEDELQLLRDAGFSRIDVLGGFDGRPFDPDSSGADPRLIIRCYRDV